LNEEEKKKERGRKRIYTKYALPLFMKLRLPLSNSNPAI
jgi:hypothetical protein